MPDMNYRGTIIEESLGDKSVLKNVKILSTKVETVTSEHNTPWVTQWTVHSVEIPEKKADEIATELSWSFDASHPQWYADFRNDKVHYIIYNGQQFKVAIGDEEGYKDVRDYGRSIGIPDDQLDFSLET
jgi:hypothetical protein